MVTGPLPMDNRADEASAATRLCLCPKSRRARAYLHKLAYARGMLLNGREAILSRVHLLKAEISDIQRLNEQYSQQRRTLPAQQNHAQRRGRLEQIVEELKALTNRKIQ